MKVNVFLLLGFLTVKTLVAENINKLCLNIMQNACESEQECYTDHFFYCDKKEPIEKCKKHAENFRLIKNIEIAWINSVFTTESNQKKLRRFLPEECKVDNLTEIQKASLAMFVVQLNEKNEIDENDIPNDYLLMASINTLREDEDKNSQLMLEKILKVMPKKFFEELED